MNCIELFWVILAALIVVKLADVALMILVCVVGSMLNVDDDAAARKATADRVRTTHRKGSE